MKKSSYSRRTHLLPVTSRETIDIETGELSRMPVPAAERQAPFGYVFFEGFARVVVDSRMTTAAWKVFGMMFMYLPLGGHETGIMAKELQEKLGMTSQQLHLTIRVLREIGVVLPSQAHGKYHLNVEVVYRGHLTMRKRLFYWQGRKRV